VKYHIENKKGWKLGYLNLMPGFWTYGKPKVFETIEGATDEINRMNSGLTLYDRVVNPVIIEHKGE